MTLGKEAYLLFEHPRHIYVLVKNNLIKNLYMRRHFICSTDIHNTYFKTVVEIR